MNLAQRDDLEL